MKRNLKPPSRHPAAGTWSCAPQFMAKYDNREDQRISQTHRTATHDAPWSFLFGLNLFYLPVDCIMQRCRRSRKYWIIVGWVSMIKH